MVLDAAETCGRNLVDVPGAQVRQPTTSWQNCAPDERHQSCPRAARTRSPGATGARWAGGAGEQLTAAVIGSGNVNSPSAFECEGYAELQSRARGQVLPGKLAAVLAVQINPVAAWITGNESVSFL